MNSPRCTRYWPGLMVEHGHMLCECGERFTLHSLNTQNAFLIRPTRSEMIAMRTAAGARIAALEEATKQALAALKVAQRALSGVDELIFMSRGVVGLHLNGNEASWPELCGDGYMSEWLGSLDDAGPLVTGRAIAALEAALGER